MNGGPGGIVHLLHRPDDEGRRMGLRVDRHQGLIHQLGDLARPRA
jgi:hypothetical protein